MRSPNLKNELFSILNMLSLLRARATMQPHILFRVRACVSSRLLHITLMTPLGNDCAFPIHHSLLANLSQLVHL